MPGPALSSYSKGKPENGSVSQNSYFADFLETQTHKRLKENILMMFGRPIPRAAQPETCLRGTRGWPSGRPSDHEGPHPTSVLRSVDPAVWSNCTRGKWISSATALCILRTWLNSFFFFFLIEFLIFHSQLSKEDPSEISRAWVAGEAAMATVPPSTSSN